MKAEESSVEASESENRYIFSPESQVGQLFTWGRGSKGQLGQNVKRFPGSNCALPVAVPGFSRVSHVALGEGQFACVLVTKSDGTLWSFGSNYKGRLGLGSDSPPSISKPTLVSALKGKHVIGACAGEAHAGAVTAKGLAYMWGRNLSGCLGNGTTTDSFKPQCVLSPSSNEESKSFLEGVVYLDCSNFTTAALVREKKEEKVSSGYTLMMWGSNRHGKLGQGKSPTVLPESNLPIQVMTQVSQVSVGSLYCGCVTSKGELYMWGFGKHGNLGIGRKSSTKPTAVPLLRKLKKNDSKGSSSIEEPAAFVACTRGQPTPKGGLNPNTGGGEGPHTVVLTHGGAIYTFGTAHKGLMMNLGNKTGAFNKPWDELTPYRVGGRLANGKLTRPPTSPFAIRPPYSSIAPAIFATNAHIHSTVLNGRGELWAWGCGSNDGRCGVERFLDGPGHKVDKMKCYMMGPHRVGVSREEFWKHPKGQVQFDKMNVLSVATGRNTMACIAVRSSTKTDNSETKNNSKGASESKLK
mmetsp:Transcript_18180/g.27288  ORF Transcript_18180/g.27288 Transcript_18180/m.27288 type:complete len:523 (-) Transcript_18180:140-1708(-)